MLLAVLGMFPQAASGQHTPGGVGLGVHAGRGQYPASPGLNGGPVHGERYVLGASVDYQPSDRLILEAQFSYGFQGGGCGDWCPGSGQIAEAAMLISPTSPVRAWGLAVGPTLAVAAFEKTRLGGGVRATVGVLRGVGPRVSAHYVLLSGGREAMGVYLSFRFGRQ